MSNNTYEDWEKNNKMTYSPRFDYENNYYLIYDVMKMDKIISQYISDKNGFQIIRVLCYKSWTKYSFRHCYY